MKGAVSPRGRRARKAQGGRRPLEAALATLIQKQAVFVQSMTVFSHEVAEMRKDFARIEACLIRHERLLAALPEAIKEKIGFH